MNPEYTSDALPNKLVEYLANAGEPSRFRRRAVLTSGNGKWALLCCTVECFVCNSETLTPASGRRYEKTMLYEDVLSATQCLEFATELTNGIARFGDLRLEREAPLLWRTELVPLSNDYMASAGLVVGLRIGQTGGLTDAHMAPLLSPDQPYYPDIEEAARNWLSFRVYHGNRDGRNDQIFFLLPETRAFVSDATFSDDGTLDITVAGTMVDQIPLITKGAYWEGAAIRHFDARVENSMCRVAVPTHIDRLEYYLIDQAGKVFDFHREERLSGISLGRKLLGSMHRSLSDQITKALHDGEGQCIEFKPFIEPEQSHGSSTHKTKLRELVTTVVAFANTLGGHVYIGVDDDCNPAGIDQQLAQWAKASANDVSVNRYLGALKSKIKNCVHGEVELQLSHTYVDGVLIVIVGVPPATQKPVTVLQDAHLYARTGASNRKVPPESWRSILDTKLTDTLWLSPPS